MHRKFLSCAAVFAAAVCTFAGETVLVNTVFDSKEHADTWKYMGSPYPQPVLQQNEKYQKHLSLEKEGDITFLKTGGPFYIGYLLEPAIKINDSLVKVEITVRLRNAKGANVISIAASDEPYYFYSPFPRKGARDSGIMVSGYQYGNSHNFVMYRKEGTANFMRPATPPVNLLGDRQNHQWVTWKLTLNHAERQLEFTRDGEEKPSLIQYGVDLSGVELKRFYLRCSCDYQWAKVVVVTK